MICYNADMEIVLGRNGFSITDISEEERVEVAEYFGKPKLLGIAHECLPVVRALLEIFATAEPPIKIDLRELEAEHLDITPFHLRQGVAYIALGLEEIPGAKFPDKKARRAYRSQFSSYLVNNAPGSGIVLQYKRGTVYDSPGRRGEGFTGRRRERYNTNSTPYLPGPARRK